MEEPSHRGENLTRPRFTAAVWIGLSVLWFFLGLHKVAQHEEFGWFLCAVWAVVAIMWSYRFYLSRTKTKN